MDAFTDRAFAGNPAAVVLLDAEDWPDEQWMRDIAAEMNLSETAFAFPLVGSVEADWALRWFTPAAEVNLCGHATLATVHALKADARVADQVSFRSRSGILGARVAADGRITLDFPAATSTLVTEPAGLAEALGVAPDAVYSTGTLRDVLVILADEAAVRGLAPNITELEAITRREGVRGVIVTASAKDPSGGHDYVSRFFAPAVGVAEDPVTGSAHTALGPFWAERLGRPDLVGLQASARGGVVHTLVVGDRVELTGQAVTVLDGTLLPPASSHPRAQTPPS
ncbi:PhzF family phenazine biosynthesis isomerase [Phytoactinopolyspora sp. XMNu-373]|uniref:PhzF family phenazine biosynthesis isomerase n=1 Tax=Phytoactinopolyspora mesophila TaxID=2650750 RepID=A0A7K3M4N0_9ACTN|nr:PhzF family phenazine biosynthesis isomerase [Phytoactinopolyspora mesophila]